MTSKYNITDEQINNLLELAKQIQIHCELDWEVTLGGNGTNAHEANSTMREVLQMLKLTAPEATEEEINQLKEEYGYDD